MALETPVVGKGSKPKELNLFVLGIVYIKICEIVDLFCS